MSGHSHNARDNMQAINAQIPSPLLTLPRELRDEIFAQLSTSHHVYTSSATPNNHSLHRSSKAPATYIDTRISLPARPPANVLETCKQLREECLEFHARLLNSSQPSTIADTKPVEETTSNQLAARINTATDERIERTLDADCVRITLEVLRGFRGNMGFFMPKREIISPRFMGLLPILSRVKRIKFTVWAGYDWWRGPVKRTIRPGVRERARFKHTTLDLDDQLRRPTLWKEDPAGSAEPAKPNAVSAAIETILEYLPLVEEINVDVLVDWSSYLNWDLPDNKLEGLQGWLDGPLCAHRGGRLRKTCRRLLVVDPGLANGSATLLRQLDIRKGDTNVVCVQRGFSEIPEDAEVSAVSAEEPSFTVTYERTEGPLAKH